jgi:hypothetical protein
MSNACFRKNMFFSLTANTDIWLLVILSTPIISLVDSASTKPPAIQGSWTVVYETVEMKGDRGKTNACQGPFPWKYTWQFDICQGNDAETGAPSRVFVALISGTTVKRVYTFSLSTSQTVQTNCKDQYNYVNEAPVTINAAVWGFPQNWEIMKCVQIFLRL